MDFFHEHVRKPRMTEHQRVGIDLEGRGDRGIDNMDLKHNCREIVPEEGGSVERRLTCRGQTKRKRQCKNKPGKDGLCRKHSENSPRIDDD